MGNGIITTRRVVPGFAEVQPFVIYETSHTKIVFNPEINERGVRGHIMRIRKAPNGNDEDIIPVDFRTLHPNEGVAIELRTDAMKDFYERITQLYDLLEEHGIRSGIRHYIITDPDALIITDQNKAAIIQKLLDADLSEEIWAQLAASNPDVAEKLANAQIQSSRASALATFEAMLEDDTLPEQVWQSFFEDNIWIFGYGLRYQILNLVQAQPHYGGTDFTGRGGERGDFLTHTQGNAKFTCLVEIKTPSTSLLQNTAYRNGVWGVSSELAGAVSQVQVNCAEWENEGSRTERTRDQL